MMKANSEAIGLIQAYEGFSSQIYTCTAGVQTIGYGHVVKPGEDFCAGITRDVADQLLQQDVIVSEHAVNRLIPVPLNFHQLAALTSFTFNLGAGALQRSSLRRKVNRGQHDCVPAEFLRWVYAGGRKLPGLVRRRAAEAGVYANDRSKNICYV